MDGIHSFEKRSKSRQDNELGVDERNRLIVVDQNGLGRSSAKLGSKTNSSNKSQQEPPLILPGNFPSNELRTSKYTLLTFLPKNLFEQFRRVANFYFLVTGLLQIVLPYSPVGPTTSLLPLFFVVSVTSIKQAYEDYLRHKLDDQVNNRLCHVVRKKKLIKIRSKDIRVGDFVYVRNNEEIPCDMILLAASGPGDRCYVTTANLDGETSLKGRSCFQVKEQLGSIEKLCDALLVIECEHPNATLYEFNATLRSPKGKRSYDLLINELKSLKHQGSSGATKTPSMVTRILKRLRKSRTKSHLKQDSEEPHSIFEAEHHEIPLDITNLLLRASRLRNTGHVYGLAVYTGRDTKLALNSQVKPNKFSSTESKVNTFLLLAFLILILCSLIATSRYERPDYWYFAGIERADSLTAIFAAHFLLFNYLVPISLYVTLEFVKFFGTMSVTEDKKMRVVVWQTVSGAFSSDVDNGAKAMSLKQSDPSLSQPSARKNQVVEKPKCNSSDLNEELGLVEVLFSDKTGTLTENRMRFMACSIQGHIYRTVNDKLFVQPAHLFHAEIPNLVRQLASVNFNRQAHLAPIRSRFALKSTSAKSPKSPSSQTKPFDHQVIPPMNDLKLADRSEAIVEFFLTLCLCSTITLNETQPIAECLPDKTLGEYDFQSASPDEESLITAAHLYGITMCKSNERDCYIVVERKGLTDVTNPQMGKFKSLVETHESTSNYIVRHFKRLLVFEFTSIRKRMSVIYQDCDNDCYIMVSKGSEELLDCIRLNKLNHHDERVVNITMSHFEAFAKSGLRTLLVARRVVHKSEYDKIVADMKHARLAIQGRDHLLNKVYREGESNLTLIGTTAVEDTLQEGVPETIENLRRAGIKVWLLTGDKVETAISVAYLCKLLERDMTLFQLVRQQDANSCAKLVEQFRKKIEESTNKSVRSMRENNYALVADGRSLHYAMRQSKTELAELCRRCTCVLGCRLSPLQKAEVVDMIKQSSERPITAAIGDGANDVSMIQEAHVGIGVAGKEGRQAVNSSDFAISRFHLLNRLLFVHGHLFYHRTANTIHYFFYKNVLFILPQFLYSFFNLSSALSIYHPMLLIGYNLFFTSLPILIYGLYEVPIPEIILENFPELYRMNRRDRQLRMSVFVRWLLLGAIQAFTGFFALFLIWGSHTPFLESGKMVGINGFSIILYFVIIFTATFRLFFLARSHSVLLCIAAIASCTILPLSLYGYSFLSWKLLVEDVSLYGQFRDYLFSLMFWLAIITCLSVTLLPDMCLYIPQRIDYLREVLTVTRNKDTQGTR